jgi:type III secretion system FlhB-like substrate exporter
MQRHARAAAVPVHEDDALVAVLARVPAGEEIPEAVFDAVAALLRPLVASGRVEGPRAAP